MRRKEERLRVAERLTQPVNEHGRSGQLFPSRLRRGRRVLGRTCARARGSCCRRAAVRDSCSRAGQSWRILRAIADGLPVAAGHSHGRHSYGGCVDASQKQPVYIEWYGFDSCTWSKILGICK